MYFVIESESEDIKDERYRRLLVQTKADYDDGEVLERANEFFGVYDTTLVIQAVK